MIAEKRKLFCFWYMTNCHMWTFRSAAAVEVVTRELKMRTTNVNMPRPPEAVGGPRGGKRKRTAAPEETCPYCNHIYTVRDGLSTKTDLEGNRYTPYLGLCACVRACVSVHVCMHVLGEFAPPGFDKHSCKNRA